MKLLVLAQTPPPLHGQSLMVRTLVDGLPACGISLQHVNLVLSRDAGDIGAWRPGKIGGTVLCALRALAVRLRGGYDTLYYVPAPPGRRGALYRDWAVMLICRPFFRQTVLHWHAAGLGEWLDTKASPLERLVTRALLGRADLALVLANTLRSDAERLCARRIAIVSNGIADPGAVAPVPDSRRPFRVLFLGLCSEAKGLFLAAAAVMEANRREQATDPAPAFVLTAAGPFADQVAAVRFRELAATQPNAVIHAGIVGGENKRRLFEECHTVCLPTVYAAEAQPLVLLEALAHDRPVVATRWRGIPELVSHGTGLLVPPGDVSALADALRALRDHSPPVGECRTRFLAAYSRELHLAALAAALRSLQ